MTVKSVETCPDAFDIEPMCFDVDPQRAVAHAAEISKQFGIGGDRPVRVAMGVVVPSAEQPGKILYGLRRPDYHTEYKNTWGLPSIGVDTQVFAAFGQDGNGYRAELARVSERKLAGVPLIFDRPVAWTGRLRLTANHPEFTENYYLVMVDVKTKPVSPSILPSETAAYSQLRWLTPDEHTALILRTPTRACGACSDLASMASRLGKL